MLLLLLVACLINCENEGDRIRRSCRGHKTFCVALCGYIPIPGCDSNFKQVVSQTEVQSCNLLPLDCRAIPYTVNQSTRFPNKRKTGTISNEQNEKLEPKNERNNGINERTTSWNQTASRNQRTHATMALTSTRINEIMELTNSRNNETSENKRTKSWNQRTNEILEPTNKKQKIIQRANEQDKWNIEQRLRETIERTRP